MPPSEPSTQFNWSCLMTRRCDRFPPLTSHTAQSDLTSITYDMSGRDAAAPSSVRSPLRGIFSRPLIKWMRPTHALRQWIA
jgi:hypothetical protein